MNWTVFLITHEHSDHIQGLGVFSRKYGVPIYATPGTIEGIKSCASLGKMPDGILHPITVDEKFMLGDIKVDPFAISHDANEPSGYRMDCGGKSVAVATDLGIYDDIHGEETEKSGRSASGGKPRCTYAGSRTLSVSSEAKESGRQGTFVQRIVRTDFFVIYYMII